MSYLSSKNILIVSLFITACGTPAKIEHKDSQCYHVSYGGRLSKNSLEKEIQYNRCLRESKPYLINAN